MKDVIITRTPLRISFAGGGTDLEDFSREHGGAVLSTAIDKYVYVTVKRHSPLFNEPIRLNYSETELRSDLSEITNHIARECLRLLEIEPPIYVSTVADVPSHSGLGSSSSFAVGLLKALHRLRGETVSAGQLAEEACVVEITRLGKPIGRQDQFAAAYGGLNFIEFKQNNDVSVCGLSLSLSEMRRLFNHVMMFWTGMSRSSEDVLGEQRQRTAVNFEQLSRIRDQASELHDILRHSFDPHRMGALLHEGWMAKRRLASTISTTGIDVWYDRARAAGALGGKVCGAGGGGFLLFIVEPERQAAVHAALSDLNYLSVGWEPKGATLLYPNGH
jgi:D-glycero-alpha-D-manno-heptose-7-phosphate kinase